MPTTLSVYIRSGGDSSSCSDLRQRWDCLLSAEAQGSATHSGLHTVEMASHRLDDKLARLCGFSTCTSAQVYERGAAGDPGVGGSVVRWEEIRS